MFILAGTDLSPGLQASLVSSVELIFVGFSFALVDKHGRKILLIVSDSLMALALFAIGAYFYLDENK